LQYPRQNSVDYQILNKDGKKYAHLEVRYFGEDTAKEFEDAVTDILTMSIDGVILDVRNNTGGYLESSIKVSSEFLPRGDVVVYESFANGDKNEFKAKNGSRLQNLPVIMLINEGSASASEILAGALRDNRGIKLIGKTTFGKGSVQELKKFKDGSSMRISIAEWLTPSQKNINGEGLQPDIEVELTDEDYNNDKDPQLDKALEEITNTNEGI
jgi:carboxyl-terminal processing protease